MSISQNYNFKLNDIEKENIQIFLDLPIPFAKKIFKIDEPYYRKIKRWMDNTKNNNWNVKDKYSISECKRMFGVNTTIQTFSNEIKSFIFGKTNYDFDMKNAAFGFCRYIINTYFPSKLLEYGTLIDYSNQREKYFKNGNNKLSYITILFSSNPKSYIKKYNDDDVNELILQIHNFQQLVIDNKHLFSFVNLKNAKDTNGSKLSYIIFGYENELLQECIAEFKDIIKSPIFDGFITSKSCNLNKTLSRLNEIGEKYGIEFTNKSFMNIVIPENIDNSTDYEMVKEEFEDNHFYVEYPSEFIVEDNDGSDISIRRYSKKDFADVVAPFNVEEKPFLPLWLKDRKRRKYKGIKWCPKITNDKDYYNSFQGFKSVEVDDVDMELVNPFIDHWNLLCNGEEEVVDYVLKYLSHMIQKPEEIPQVALLFQGLQGTGKDIATSQLGFMVGQKLIHKEEKCENIFGTFNSCMENKLVLQVNEISGTDGFKHKESFKDLITAENLNIRRMRTELYDTPNYLRCFLFSNNLTPIQIPQDDRRYMVIKTGNPQSKGYYSKLVKHYTNEEVNNHIYTYLKRMDIVGYTPHGNRVETEAYRNMKEMCKNPFYEFFYEILKNDEWFGRYEVKGKIYFSSKKILDSYKEYTDGYNIIINFKNIKSVILNLGGKEKKIFKNHKQYRGYEINVEEVIEKLEQHYGVNDEEVINLDSDSDDEYDSDDDDRFRVINKNNEI
tara:strand:+ start:889 stop:3057 length:2169 start_codon:yes stop_codon:yes gene_type:complete